MTGPKLGRLPTKTDPRALQFARFAAAPRAVPAKTDFWTRRAPFPLRSFGNLDVGDCTIAKQATGAQRMERLETRRTDRITDEEVVRVYFAMTDRLYGGGDTGAFETDALNNWRDPALTFRDVAGHPLTIDAYLRVNAGDQTEVKAALWAAQAHGLAICLNLPNAFQDVAPPNDWVLPVGQRPVGDYLAGSWGGHSMWADDYDEVGLWLPSTWERPRQRLSWNAAAAYMDECHIVIDSIDAWRAKKPTSAQAMDLAGIRQAVNRVSSHKLA